MAASQGESCLPEHNLDVVLAAVVGQRDERPWRKQGSVKTDTRYPSADSVRVLDGDAVEGPAMTAGDLEAFPASGNARIDAQGGTSLP